MISQLEYVDHFKVLKISGIIAPFIEIFVRAYLKTPALPAPCLFPTYFVISNNSKLDEKLRIQYVCSKSILNYALPLVPKQLLIMKRRLTRHNNYDGL